MFLTILIFIVILGLLVFAHEFGHFVVAKRQGVRVDEFGFGFPPRLFSIKKGETTYSINAIPIGGFVKIYGEEGEGKKNRRSFATKKPGRKALIILAGVAMNFLLAIFLYSIGHFVGLPTALSDQEAENFPESRVEIIGINLGSPAALADLKLGDRVITLIGPDGRSIQPVKKISQFQEFIGQNQGKEINLVLERGKTKIEKELIPRTDPPSGQGPLGIQLANVAEVSYPWYQAPIQGFLTTLNLTGTIILIFFEMIRNLFVEGRLGMEVAGPVGIFSLTGQAASLGLIYLLQLTALLSINLMVINALPFPALDGGRFLFLIIEKIKGSPVSQKVQNLAHSIGFALLIILMIFITYRDIAKLF